MGGSESTQPSHLPKASSTPIKPIGAPDPATVQPLAAFGSLGFEPKELFREWSSKVQLSLRCEELSKVAPTFVVVYSKCLGDEYWKELGMSEVCSVKTRSPVFDPSFTLEFRAEVRCNLRFEVYRVRDSYCLEDLLCQKFVGMAEVTLVDVVMARCQGNGWLTKELMDPKPKGDSLPGRIAIWAEEELSSKYTISFHVAAKGLKSSDFWKRTSDPYAVVHRTLTIPSANADYDYFDDEEPSLKCTPIYHSEVQKRTNCPRFRRIELTSSQLCNNNNDQEIVVELYDWFRVQRHRYMGEAVTTLGELQKAFRLSRPLELPLCYREGPRVAGIGGTQGQIGGRSRSSSRNTTKDTARMRTNSKDTGRLKSNSKDRNSSKGTKFSNRTSTKDTRVTSDSGSSKGSDAKAMRRMCGRLVGMLRFEEVGVERRYSFLDYIRGGLELRLIVAVDFTRSNVGPHHPDSFHYMHAERPSAYATAIRSVGNVMRTYSSSNKFMTFGFGAKIPPSHTIVSDCFSLTGDFFNPKVTGVDGMIQAYQRAVRVTHLHGPTRLSQVIRLGADFSRPYAEANTKNDNGVDMRYHVLLILTDGAIDDQVETLSEIAKAGDLPLSIVVIGIGHEDFTFLEDLTNEVSTYRRLLEESKPPEPAKQEQAGLDSMGLSPGFGGGGGGGGAARAVENLRGPTRNIVHFIEYNHFRDRPRDLAAAALVDLPREVCGYYTGKDIKPRGLDQMEDGSGNTINKNIPPMVTRKGTGSKALPANENRFKTRSASNLSNAGGNGGNADGTEKDSAGRKEGQLPQFMENERARLMKEAQSVGYDTNLIKRAFRHGIASNTLECLVDNIVHAGYGKLPSYKEAAEQAIPVMEATLPGQPFARGAADHTASMPIMGIGAAAAHSSMPLVPMSFSVSEGPLKYKAGATKVHGAMGGAGRVLSEFHGGLGSRAASKASVHFGGHNRAASNLSDGSLLSKMSKERRNRFGSEETFSSDKVGLPSRPGNDSLSGSMSSFDVTDKPPRVRQLSTESMKAIMDGDNLTRRTSPNGILVQSREGTKEVKRFTKELRASFNLDEDGGGGMAARGSPSNALRRAADSTGSLGSTRSAGVGLPELRETAAAAEPDAGSIAEPELGVCGICLEAPVNTELRPCQHRVACDACASKLGVVCPLCQGTVTEVKKLG